MAILTKTTKTRTTANNNNNNETASNPKLVRVLHELLGYCFVIVSGIKILLVPSYKSTDFDVHRNWLAITKHLPIEEWYYNDVNGTTVHTLDYPPTFAYFEFLLSNNPVADWWLKNDTDCLELWGDDQIYNNPDIITPQCVLFHRSTVILSDILLWLGTYVAVSGIVPIVTTAASSSSSNSDSTNNASSSSNSAALFLKVFLCIVCHPGLLWLDHVHFQYNGMLLGILLLSIGCLFHANRYQHSNNNDNRVWFHVCSLASAVFYVVLVTMKHLYLPLGPFYFVYLLRNYCFRERQQKLEFQWKNFCGLGIITLTSLLVPFVPFRNHLKQLFVRLFPFGRGLVHDYWAANVWAIYMFLNKFKVIKINDEDVPPKVTVLLLLVNLLPILYLITWKQAKKNHNNETKNNDETSGSITTTTTTSTTDTKNKQLLHVVIFSSFAQFMFAYHVHEKAIMSVLIPFVLLIGIELKNETNNDDDKDNGNEKTKSKDATPGTIYYLWFQCTAIGLLGLFPLLFRSIELPMKLVTYTGYMLFCYSAMIPQRQTTAAGVTWWLLEFGPVWMVQVLVIVVFELVPLSLFGRYEFLPLMITSVLCSVGLIVCYVRFTVYILNK